MMSSEIVQDLPQELPPAPEEATADSGGQTAPVCVQVPGDLWRQELAEEPIGRA